MTATASPDTIASFVDNPSTTMLLFDIDGVLAEITDDPADTVISPEVQQLLAAAADRFAGVGIVTGRSLEKAREMVGIDALPIAAAHGMHMHFPDGTHWVDPVATAARPQLDLAVQMARTVGWRFEDKVYTIALHFRHIADPERTEQQMRSQISTVLDPRVTEITGAKLAIEIRPVGASTKGTAVQRLCERHEQLEQVVYVGDDLTDLDAFEALVDGAASGLRVAVTSDEAPTALLEHADVVLDGPDAVVAALQALVAD